VTARKEQCHFVPQIVYCAFPYKRWSSNVINIQLLAWLKAECFPDIEVFRAAAAQRTWAELVVTQMLCCLCSEQQWVCWWGSNSSGNVGCQRTVNSMLLKLCSEQQSVCWCGSNSSGNVGCQRTVNSMLLKLPSSALQYRWMSYRVSVGCGKVC
jgi:hypothetical protein